MEKSYKDMKKEFMYFYHNEVKNNLLAYEKERKEGAKKIFVFNLIFFLMTVAFILGFICTSFESKFPWISNLFLIIFFTTLICSIYLTCITRNDKKSGSTSIKTDFEKDLKAKFMKNFVKIFMSEPDWTVGMTKNKNVYTPGEIDKIFAKIEDIRKQNIINPFLWLFFDDTIHGTFKDLKINIYETDARIINQKTKYIIPFFVIFFIGMNLLPFILTPISLLFLLWLAIVLIKLQKSLFRGVIVEIEMNKNFSGHTFFHEKSHLSKKIHFNNKVFLPVNLEKSLFSDNYQVFSDNQIEARYLLTTAMMERIEQLSFAFKSKYVRGSFCNNKITIAIHTGKDMFAMGNDFKESNSDTFSELYDEMISILKIIDTLKLDEHTGL